MFAKVSILLLSATIGLGALSVTESQAQIHFTVNISDNAVPVEDLWPDVEIHFLNNQLVVVDEFLMEEVDEGVYQYTNDPEANWIYWEVEILNDDIVPQVPSQNPAPERQIWYQPHDFDWEVQDNR